LALLTVPLGLAVHLFAELVEFGAGDLALVASPRHAYLWATLASGLIAGLLAVRVLGVREALRRAHLLGSALPGRGKGAGFLAASFAAQFAVFALTQAAEGDPMAGGSLALGLTAAVAGAAVSALAVSFLGRRLARAVGEFVWFVTRAGAASPAASFSARAAVRRPVRHRAAGRLKAPNRAPPSVLLATA
jgi:hypothetical protein